MKNKLKQVSMVIGLSSFVFLPASMVISCSKPTSTNNSVFEYKFETLVSSTTKQVEMPSEVNVYDPNYNTNAQKKLDEIKENLSVENLNKDFRMVLTDFYEAYEYESTNTEIEIESIKVKSKNPNNSFILEVRYEIEKENRDSDEQILTKDIEWTPNLVLISKEGINEIKKTILSYSNKDSQEGIDLSDIKEIFFGEKDDDLEFDDYGIFDKIAFLNKEYNSQAYLLGYEISLNDIFGQLLTTKSGLDLNTKFLVPSLSLNIDPTIFVPNNKPEIDYTLKTNLTQDIISKTFDSVLLGQTIIELPFETNSNDIMNIFNAIFANPPLQTDLVGSKEISSIIISKDEITKEYKIFVKFALSKKAPDMIIVKSS